MKIFGIFGEDDGPPHRRIRDLRVTIERKGRKVPSKLVEGPRKNRKQRMSLNMNSTSPVHVWVPVHVQGLLQLCTGNFYAWVLTRTHLQDTSVQEATSDYVQSLTRSSVRQIRTESSEEFF